MTAAVHRVFDLGIDPTDSLPVRLAHLAAALGGDPALIRFVRAPGRVNLMGDHTDYNDGLVLPFAIDRDCLVAARPRSDRAIRARSAELPGTVELTVDDVTDPRTVEPPWGRFVAGALRAVSRHRSIPTGLDLAVTSTVPAGSGLSSSSALAVGLVLTLAEASGVAFDPRDAARLALEAELLATGVPGGLMDQLTSLLAHAGTALLIDCRSLDSEPVPLPHSVVVLVVHSGRSRTLARSAYADRRAACEAAAVRLGVPALRDATLEAVADDPIARHVVTENQRVRDLADALRADDRAAIGRLLLASHASLRDDFHASTPALDALVQALVTAGALGARLTGAGFGGCVVALVERTEVDRVTREAAESYRRVTALEPTAFVVRPVAGAGAVTLTS